MALRLGLDHANRLAIGVEQVVGEATLEGEFPNRHAQARRDVHFSVVLHDPARFFKLVVDLLAGLLFGGHRVETIVNEICSIHVRPACNLLQQLMIAMSEHAEASLPVPSVVVNC